MKVSKVLKKRVSLFRLSFIFIILAVLVSLFFINKSDFVKNDVQLDNNNLRLVYKKGNKGAVVPMNFEDGKTGIVADRLEIVNKSKLSTMFSLCVQQVDASSDSLTTDKLYYLVNDVDGGILGNTDGCIYTGKISGNDSIELNVKIWPGSDLISSEDMGKTLNLKFIVK